MDSRKFSPGMQFGLLWMSLAIVSLTCSHVEGKEPEFVAQLKQADRIVVATPAKAVDVSGGKTFSARIDNVLRGSGQRGGNVEIVQSGDEKSHPKFEAGQAYVFLLKRLKAEAGWQLLTTQVLPVTDGKVSTAGGDELSLDDFQQLVASHPNEMPVEEAPAPRTSLAGTWILSISQQGTDISLWLLDITEADGKYSAKLVATSRLVSASMLKSAEITASEAHIVVTSDGQNFDFRGKLTDGLVPGSMAVDQRAIVVAQLMPSSATSMKAHNEPQEAPGRDSYLKAVSAGSADKLSQFIKDHPDSPLILEAYNELISLKADEDKVDPAALDKLAEQFLQAASRWSSRIVMQTYVELGANFSQDDKTAKLARKYLTAAEKSFTDETPKPWKVSTRLAMANLLLKEDETAKGVAMLSDLHQQNPFEPEITYLLARESEKEGKADEALELYSEIAALPMLERMLFQTIARKTKDFTRDQLPSQVAERIWKKKHGNLDKFDRYLDEVYEKRLLGFATDKVPTRKPGEGTRVVLCELFTGSECPPCIGADVAAAGLEATYPSGDVIVLRYHQHIPAPDPLANDASQQRFQFYQGEGTPSMVVNGERVSGVGGFLGNAAEVYAQLRKLVDPFLTEKIALKIDLSAKADAGIIHLKAVAGGLTFPEQVRLVVVLAEDKVLYPAGNGIRFHEMVVRDMPAGIEGVAPEQGKLSFSGEIDVSRLRSSLKKYLTRLETELAEEFPSRPLDLTRLHVVAFLQDMKTQVVLQAASVPVTGTIPAPAPEESKSTKESKPSKPAAEDDD